MKITAPKILKAATKVAKDFGFDDPESAFWQCNVFSNAVVKAARLFDVHDLDLILVMAQWQTPSGDVIAGDTHRHVLIRYNNKFYDFTIRQVNANAKFPYVGQKLPRYYTFMDEVDVEDLGESEREYLNAIVEEVSPEHEVQYAKSNPNKNNPSENDYYFEFDGDTMTVLDVIKEWRIMKRKAYDAYVHGDVLVSDLWSYREFERPLRDDLVKSMEKEGYRRSDPIIVIVLQSGPRHGALEAYVAEGNHRLVAAKHLGIKRVPVRFVFWKGDAERDW